MAIAAFNRARAGIRNILRIGRSVRVKAFSDILQNEAVNPVPTCDVPSSRCRWSIMAAIAILVFDPYIDIAARCKSLSRAAECQGSDIWTDPCNCELSRTDRQLISQHHSNTSTTTPAQQGILMTDKRKRRPSFSALDGSGRVKHSNPPRTRLNAARITSITLRIWHRSVSRPLHTAKSAQPR